MFLNILLTKAHKVIKYLLLLFLLVTTHIMNLRLWHTRLFSVDFTVLRISHLQKGKRSSGDRWHMEERKRLSMESILRIVPFHQILVTNLEKVNGIWRLIRFYTDSIAFVLFTCVVLPFFYAYVFIVSSIYLYLISFVSEILTVATIHIAFHWQGNSSKKVQFETNIEFIYLSNPQIIFLGNNWSYALHRDVVQHVCMARGRSLFKQVFLKI